MNVNELTIGQLKELSCFIGSNKSEPCCKYGFMVNKKFLIRTVTYHALGLVTEIIGDVVKLENASWLADSGRFSDCIAKGTINEVEPVGIMYLNMTSVCDFFEWKHDLTKEKK